MKEIKLLVNSVEKYGLIVLFLIIWIIWHKFGGTIETSQANFWMPIIALFFIGCKLYGDTIKFCPHCNGDGFVKRKYVEKSVMEQIKNKNKKKNGN